MVLITIDEAAEVLQPGEESFDFPAMAVTAQRAPVLCRRPGAIIPVGRNHLDAPLGHAPIERIAVIGAIPDQALGWALGESPGERVFDKRDLMWARRRNVYGDRSAKAVCHCHELRTLAPLGFSDASAPFLAPTKLPSMKHSDRSKSPLRRRCRASARSTFSSTPLSTQPWNRRWHVW